ENHQRRDSLVEFLALAVSLDFRDEKTDLRRAGLIGKALDRATGTLLEEGHSPSRKVNELDNRGSHFHLARNWARELASQTEDAELAAAFAPIAERLQADADTIVAELGAVQGSPVDLGGYYHVDREKTDTVMRPSATLNAALAAI
ncbi:MAG: NADP-dependent isocitrate dehydrogenase, partial [Solirubrobacteraceae bacterium]